MLKVKSSGRTEKQRGTWKKSPAKKRYSENDLIDAYITGKEAGMAQQEQVLIEKLKTNIEKAQTIVEKFYKYLNKKFDCHYLKLRATEITEFDALFVVEQSDFIKDDFKQAYKEARKLKKEVNEPTFNISFSFMPYSKNIDKDSLLIDGYFLQYGEKKTS